MEDTVLSVSDFVGFLNQTLEFAYPSVTIQGELANFRVSKNRWVYFDLKDELASVKFFGTVYQLSGPLEDGLMVQVRGNPRLHPQYGFSVTVQAIQPVGEGSIKRAAALLEAKLAAEGLFDPARKRPLPYPPRRIGLIASGESAAYQDFMKILNARWGGVEVRHADVQVQGESAPGQIVAAIEHLNTYEDVEVLVLTRGGGSAEDLAAFSAESVTRAVAASRLPTLVAIGHEVDVSLAELAADKRASTPSNAAELLVPDKRLVLEQLPQLRADADELIASRLIQLKQQTADHREELESSWQSIFKMHSERIQQRRQLLKAFDPSAALKRGYAIVRFNDQIIKSGKNIKQGDALRLELADAAVDTKVERIDVK